MMSGPRIVSLIASATETVAALGLLNQLVGRSHECDYPLGIENRPICSRPKIDYRTSSFRIDQQITSLLRDGLSIYEVDVDLLKSLRPDIVITQTHCEVCAVSEKDVACALQDWLGTRPQLVSLRPDRLADVWTGISEIATACGVASAGTELVLGLQTRLDALRKRTVATGRTPTVGCIEWVEPLMVAGNWMPELVAIAGGSDPLGQLGRHSPLCSWERFAQADPDVILITPCGYDLHRTLEELPVLRQRAEWTNLKAVKASQVFLADGNAYFNRPGPRLVESAEILAELLHPTEFPPRHEGTAWVRANALSPPDR